MEGYILLTVFLSFASLNFAQDPLCSGVPPGEVVLFPYPTDCSRYYECDGGVKTEKSCPSGLWFNNALQSCDHPGNSGCVPSTTAFPAPSCTAEIVDYYPYPSDCTRYIECYYGSLEVHTCPSGLWFNAKEKRCVLPDESECGVSPTPTEPTYYPTWTTPDEACWGVLPGETSLRPYPGDCNRFIECSGSWRTDMQCPPHLYFNYEKQLCDWPSESGCDDTTRTPDPSTTDYPTPPTTPSGDDDPRCYDGNTNYWPHASDCDKYIECYNGHGYTMECPSGLYFDSRNKRCVNPSDSDCGRTTISTDKPETTTKDHDWTPDPECPWPSTERYLYPYPGDCTKFWECAEGEKVIASCPPDLWFNPTLLVCDYPYHSGCKY